MGADTWATTPSMTDGDDWKADKTDNGAWQPESTDADADENFIATGEFQPENVSKHAGDGGCCVCGADGHFARDCPDKKPSNNECYLCHEVGHNKADCPQAAAERTFSAFANWNLQDLTSEEAWRLLEEADKEKDVDEIRNYALTYAQSLPELTWPELETAFRESGMNTRIIAKEQEVADTHTIVNLQGQIDQKYVISFQFSAQPRRKIFAAGWPSSPGENLARLAEAGFAVDRQEKRCSNCNQIGHSSRQCSDEKNEKAKIIITCSVCSGENHRARDCTEPRRRGGKDCRVCGEVGHVSKDCPSQTCYNCQGVGHASKDCENERVIKCRNCDAVDGHMSKDCPKPTDWSRVRCTQCQELGHSYKRCPNPAAANEDGDEHGETGAGHFAGADKDASGGAASGGDEGGWGTSYEPTVSSGGW